MKPLTFFIIIFHLILLAGCEKQDLQPLLNTEGMLKRIEDENHTIIGEYTYRKNGLPKESWYHKDIFMSDKNESYTYTFNSKNQLIRKEGFQPGNMMMSSMTGAMDKNVTINYEYDSNNRIVKIHAAFSYEDFEEINHETIQRFEYPEEDIIITSFNYIDEQANSVNPKTKYSLDKKGNIETLELYYETNNGKQTNYLEEYTYDSHPSIVSIEPGIHPTNNVLEKTMTSYNYDENGNQSIGYVSTYTYSYEYNRQGYPEKMIETWPNEVQKTYYYYYY